MKYQIPKGYVIATKQANELAIKHDLSHYQKNVLYRYLLQEAKKGNKKYNDNTNSRIWLLDVNSYNEEALIKMIKNDNGQISIFDEEYQNILSAIDKDSNDTTIISTSDNLSIINLIDKINNSNLDVDTKLTLIKIICHNEK